MPPRCLWQDRQAMSRVLTIILNWRTPEMTIGATAAALTALEGIPGALVIVDNDSGDGSLEKLRAVRFGE